MSQEKVDRYKNEKANRKKYMKRQHLMNFIRKTVLALAAFALIGWLGYSAYDTHQNNKERASVSVNYDAVNTYMSGLSE